MEDRSGFAFSVLVVTLVLAFIGDLLLRATPWGLNFPIWILLTGVCAAGLVRKSPISLSRAALWLCLPIGIFSLCFFWRDSDELKIANGVAIFCALGVLVLRAHQGKPHVAGIVDYTFKLVGAWLLFTADFAALITKDVSFGKDSRQALRATALVRGLIIALPLLLVFGALFASGDAVFSQDLKNLLSFDFGSIIADILIFSAIALIVGGLFRRLFLHIESAPVVLEKAPGPVWPSLGSIELATVFGLVDALFLAFVAVQFRYYFGGDAQVAHVSGLTYADYARTGFFELTAAAGLTLPFILGFHALIPNATRKGRGIFSLLSAILVGCVLVVLCSAIERMRLYVMAYGLTELRVFTTAFMAWLALALVWLVGTVIRHRRDRFAFGALAAGYAVILALNYANPDALIASVNLSRQNADIASIADLSTDAAPAIAYRMSNLSNRDQVNLKSKLKSAWGEPRDWRSLSLSEIRYREKYRRMIGL